MNTVPRSWASSVSSATVVVTRPADDAEAQQARKRVVSHFELVFNPSGVDDEVLQHRYPGGGTDEAPYIVDFLPDDGHNPLLFPRWKKWLFTLLMATATLAISFVSTAYSGGMPEVIRDFDVGVEVAILGISLFVCGFAIGPLLWAPLSEFYGRQLLFSITYLGLTAFNAGAAVAPNITTLVLMRFFAGSFGSSPLTNSGGVIADLFHAGDRGLATAVFSTQVFLGPTIGPIIGGFLGEAHGWRWVEGLMAIFTGLVWLVCSLVVPETYAPVLLRRRAEKLSARTGRVYLSKLDLNSGRHGRTMGRQFGVALSRPWVLLFKEPIVLLTSVYTAIVYGTLYMLFAAFPIVFEGSRGWSVGVGGLAFIGLAVGMFVGVLYAVWDDRRYAALVEKMGGPTSRHAPPPEARLPPSIIASVLLPLGLFWFAWTNGPETPWIVCLIGSGLFGAGLVLVFLSLLNYLIDSYVVFAASVLAANSVMRSLFGAAFPLFTPYMYANLGIHWASSIPAFLALAYMPFPYLFYRYGHAMRMRCPYAAEAARVLERMRSSHQALDEDMAEVEAEAKRARGGPSAAAAGPADDEDSAAAAAAAAAAVAPGAGPAVPLGAGLLGPVHGHDDGGVGAGCGDAGGAQ
ncbi:hypothetical protein P8C59_005076 [Phyllachora maydis]|uniref:Major facilitator superfamily (MFS) profile domain-containing protein n=1 Tax=Phyllachora maydis TaxID=1825666 RepID=A0AAD9MBV9_9PEZI|nr:hypothetical protein P8C59_005076 [Phyllachora maydis]